MIRVFESSEAVCVDTEEPADVERGVGDDRHGAVSTLRPLIRHRYPGDKQSYAHAHQFIHTYSLTTSRALRAVMFEAWALTF